MMHPPGVVGIIAQETARFSMFASSLTALQVPDQTGVKWVFGHDIAENMNLLVEAFLNEYPDAEWLWVLGDDHAFSPEILTRLLDHNADIVVPLGLMRNQPFLPAIFDDTDQRVLLDDHPDGGVIPVHSAGSGGMLIRRYVFEQVAYPWFERNLAQGLGEDIYFCEKARDADFTIWCDLDVSLGHCTTSTVWPVREPEGWTFGFAFMGGMSVIMPKAVNAS